MVVAVNDESFSGGLMNYSPSERSEVRKLIKDIPNEYDEIINARTNFWILHFGKVRDELGEKWLDFESEIEKVSKRLYGEIANSKGKGACIYVRRECDRAIECPNFVNAAEAFVWLEQELKQLTRVLEIYLSKCVNKSLDKNSKIGLFTEIKPNKLLSFNYTTTYKDLYNFGIPTDYIHGKAILKHKPTECGLVLGFDDHYLETADTIYELIPFEKYYQRIVHRNSNNYFKWVNRRDREGDIEKKIVYFFGHSMSPADGDIIKLLIESEKTITKIFYRENYEEERASMIKNLAVILTPNELIRRVSGINPSIELIPV